MTEEVQVFTGDQLTPVCARVLKCIPADDKMLGYPWVREYFTGTDEEFDSALEWLYLQNLIVVMGKVGGPKKYRLYGTTIAGSEILSIISVIMEKRSEPLETIVKAFLVTSIAYNFCWGRTK